MFWMFSVKHSILIIHFLLFYCIDYNFSYIIVYYYTTVLLLLWWRNVRVCGTNKGNSYSDSYSLTIHHSAVCPSFWKKVKNNLHYKTNDFILSHSRNMDCREKRVHQVFTSNTVYFWVWQVRSSETWLSLCPVLSVSARAAAMNKNFMS